MSSMDMGTGSSWASDESGGGPVATGAAAGGSCPVPEATGPEPGMFRGTVVGCVLHQGVKRGASSPEDFFINILYS